MTIIQIRGTSGSGKSYVVHELRKQAKTTTRIMEEGRKKPIGYLLEFEGREKKLALVGHYEIVCGGVDTISGKGAMDRIFGLVRKAQEAGHDVLFEGLLASEETKRSIPLTRDYPDHIIIGLDTPIDVCLASINDRRRARNPDVEDVNPKNTTNRVRVIERAMKKLQESGANAVWKPRVDVLNTVKRELGI